MGRLKLGIIERYDIGEDQIVKYNLSNGCISPFTRLYVIDVDNYADTEDIVDIKKPTSINDIDIKKVAANKNITRIKKDEEVVDIKKISVMSVTDSHSVEEV